MKRDRKRRGGKRGIHRANKLKIEPCMETADRVCFFGVEGDGGVLLGTFNKQFSNCE